MWCSLHILHACSESQTAKSTDELLTHGYLVSKQCFGRGPIMNIICKFMFVQQTGHEWKKKEITINVVCQQRWQIFFFNSKSKHQNLYLGLFQLCRRLEVLSSCPPSPPWFPLNYITPLTTYMYSLPVMIGISQKIMVQSTTEGTTRSINVLNDALHTPQDPSQKMLVLYEKCKLKGNTHSDPHIGLAWLRRKRVLETHLPNREWEEKFEKKNLTWLYCYNVSAGKIWQNYSWKASYLVHNERMLLWQHYKGEGALLSQLFSVMFRMDG